MNKPNILFLADTAHPAKAVSDHIEAITTSKQINWHVMNPLVVKTIDKIDCSVFDAIGIHYSIKPYNFYYLSQKLRTKIAAFRGLKFQFLQDEYQQVNRVSEYLDAMGIRILFTLVNPKYLDKAYPSLQLKKLIKVPILTGYVQDYMLHLSAPPIAKRQFDVSYRARRCEYWLGSLSYEKQFIADEFVRQSQGRGLRLNISLLESDRVYGEAWFSLLKNSRAVLGTESGASIWDFDGTIEKKTRAFLKSNKKASFDAVYEGVLREFDNNIRYSAISPRIFEAAATKTPMILFPGDYNGICIPDKHYILLNKDFSNFEEVLSQLNDTDYLEQITDNAYRDLIQSGQYSQHQFSLLIENTLLKHIGHSDQKIPVSDVTSLLLTNNKKYRWLNSIRCMWTETYFVMSNVCVLLLDTRFTSRDKLLSLYKGLKRYLVYLLPRIGKA
jgi:hypothetical protein